MATTPINIPGRPSPRVTTPMLSPLRQSAASTSGQVGSPDLHMKLWTQAAGKHTVRNLLALSGRDEKLAPSDYFYSVSHLLANPSAEPNPEQASHLRQKVKTSQNLTKVEKTFVEQQAKKKETVKLGSCPELDKCPDSRAKYIKYKIDKQILLDDIGESYRDKRTDFIKDKINGLVASLRLGKTLVNKTLAGIDDFSLAEIIRTIPDFTKTYLGGDKTKLYDVIFHFVLSNPRQFKKCLSRLDSNYNPVVKKDKVKQNEINSVLAEKRSILDAVWNLVKKFDNDQMSSEELKNQLLRLPNYQKLFDEFNTDSTFSMLDLAVFSLLTASEKEEKFKEGKIRLADKINENEAKLESVLNNYFSSFSTEHIESLKKSILNDVEMQNDAYQFSQFGIKSIEDLSEGAVMKLNGLPIAKKQQGNSANEEFSFNLFDGSFSVPTESSVTTINGDAEFKNGCEVALIGIGKSWNSNRPFLFSYLHHLIQLEEKKIIAQEMIKLLDPKTNAEYADVVSIIVDDMLGLVLTKDEISGLMVVKNKSFFFNNVDQYFITFADLIKNNAEHVKLTRDISIKLINTLVNEQKRHVFERFRNLNNIHTGFVRDANYIMEKAETLQKGAGDHVRNIIVHMLENSEKEDKTVTVCDNHHDMEIMGNRKKQPDFYKHALQAAANLHDILLLPAGHSYRKNEFDHAHTFPFPAVMNWRTAKLIESIGAQGYTIDALPDLKNSKSPLLKEGFKKFKAEVMTLKSDSFRVEIDKIAVTCKDDPAKFIYFSLNLLASPYLFLLSETEYLPGFMNKFVDHLSEWSGYKTHIKDSLIAMIKSTPSSARGKFSDNFKDYIPNTLASANVKEEEWRRFANQGRDNAIVYKFMQILALQTKQAAIEAM